MLMPSLIPILGTVKMSSCEQKRSSAYSEDLRWRMVYQKHGLQLSYREREIKSEVNNVLILELNESTICRFLHSQGFTRQKLQIVAKQRSDFERAVYVMELSVHKPNMLVFLDETGCDRRNAMRRYAYSIHGKPAKSHKLLVRGKRLNAIAFMSVCGILDCHIESEAVDGDVLYVCAEVPTTSPIAI